MDWATPGWLPPSSDSYLRVPWIDRLRSGAWTRVALNSDTITGVVSWEYQLDAYPDGQPVAGEAHISSVFVAPALWRRGVGGSLLQMAEQSIRAHGYRTARLVTPEDSPARRFYEARGWTRDDVSFFCDSLALPFVGYFKPHSTLDGHQPAVSHPMPPKR